MTTTTQTSTQSADETDQVEDLPPLVQRSATHHDHSAGLGPRHRHSKKLSLNFPILVQPAHDPLLPGSGSISSWSPSPTAASSFRHGTPVSARPLPSPDVPHDNSTEAPDFLTLIAGQERRVMELKEELHKAESELMSLKKQWATYEAKKKQAEIRSKTLKMGPVSPKTAASHAEGDEAERLRRREARERKMRDLAMKEGELSRSNSNSSKRNGGRVFVGRHTRTLSLLQHHPVAAEMPQHTTRSKSRTESTPSAMQFPDRLPSVSKSPTEPIDDTTRQGSKPSITRQQTLQDLIATSATGAAQLSFGKTYKDLTSASRKSLPPGADMFVKQGKQVYDGVSQGFWNFVEDIRQATVGDEPVTGMGVHETHRNSLRKKKSNKKFIEAECERHGKRQQKAGDEHKSEKDSFWKEFGFETPNKAGAGNITEEVTRSNATTKRAYNTSSSTTDHESKSSTDSKHPPSLLADLMDVNEDDEAWDSWLAESPVASRQREQTVEIRSGSDDGDDEESESERNRVPGQPKREFTRQDLKPAGPAAETSWAELTT